MRSKKSRFPFTVILNSIQNLYRFRVKPGMTRKPKPSSRSFFPHISCKKTAKVLKNWETRFFPFFKKAFKLAFLLFLLLFLFFNFHSLIFPENERLYKAKIAVLKHPFQSKAHESLARIYLESGDFELAEREFLLAKSSFSPDQVSLAAFEQAFKKAKEKPQKIRQEISFWEKVVKEKPDYRDAYFQLAILNYQTGRKDKVVKYLQKVLDLDPNFESAERLKKLLED